MSWIQEKPEERTWLQKAVTSVLKTGPVPRHVAFIMDGNRRFATKNSIDRAEGHLQGFNKLAQTLKWCLDMGITEVTVYAFSIENFKRSKDEVDALMEIARQKFTRLLKEQDLIEEHGVSIRVLGNISLLPRDIQEIIAEAVNVSKHNTRAILNVCFSYTSRDEMCAAMRETAEGVKQGLIMENDISEEVLEKCLYTNLSRDPDLLVRTSGEVRLSDFLLWQSSYSVLSFMKVLWPEFSIWHLFGGVLHYQQNYKAIQEARDENASDRERLERESDYACVMREIEAERAQGGPVSDVIIQERLERYRRARLQRTQKFVEHVQAKRAKYLADLVASPRPQPVIQPATVC